MARLVCLYNWMGLLSESVIKGVITLMRRRGKKGKRGKITVGIAGCAQVRSGIAMTVKETGVDERYWSKSSACTPSAGGE
jgi:hypothetical protein